MPEKPEYTRFIDGVEFLNADIKLSPRTAAEGLSLLEPASLVCNSPSPFLRLPEPVLALPISPTAKLLYADIFTKTFSPTDPREYFHGQRDIANRLPVTRRSVCSAVKELIDTKLIAMTDARTSRSRRLKMTPLMVFTDEDINHDPNPEMHVKLGKPGNTLSTAIATRLRFVPLSLWVTVRMVEEGMLRIVDTFLLGWIASKASPFCYASVSEMARRLHVRRNTINASIVRLQRMHLVRKNKQGITVIAHPVYDCVTENMADLDKQITDYALKLLARENAEHPPEFPGG